MFLLRILFLLLMMGLFCFSLVLNFQKENWKYQKWDFDDFPCMCKRKLDETNEALAFANTPHFGGTPNNSQVWM